MNDELEECLTKWRQSRWTQSLKTLFMKVLYKVAQNELRKKYPNKSDWEIFSREFLAI